MPKTYNDDHLVDEFGRVIPYDNLKGSFPPGVSNEVKRATFQKNDEFRNDGSYTEGSKVKTYFDDTYGIYGETASFTSVTSMPIIIRIRASARSVRM